MFAAKFNAGECIQAVEEEPSLYSARLASKSELMYLVLGFVILFIYIYMILIILPSESYQLLVMVRRGDCKKRGRAYS